MAGEKNCISTVGENVNYFSLYGKSMTFLKIRKMELTFHLASPFLSICPTNKALISKSIYSYVNYVLFIIAKTGKTEAPMTDEWINNIHICIHIYVYINIKWNSILS